MEFLKDNIIFVFGVLSLMSIIFAASGVAKSRALSSPEANNSATESLKPVDANASDSQKSANDGAITKAKTHYQISGALENEDGFAKDGLDD